MQSKLRFIFCLFILIICLVGCSEDNINQAQGNSENIMQSFVAERIQMFSEKHFTKLQSCTVNFTEDAGIVYIEFIPDFGSITFKNEIWHWAAAHAMNLVYIFPEIKEYNYSIIDNKKEKLMDLYIDETSLKILPERFYGNRGPGDYYRYCFTRVEITKKGSQLPLDERFFEGSHLP